MVFKASLKCTNINIQISIGNQHSVQVNVTNFLHFNAHTDPIFNGTRYAKI